MKLLRILAGAALALVALSASPAVQAQPVTVYAEAKNAVKDGSPYLAYQAFWGVTPAEKVALGVDYGGRIYTVPATFPAATAITWYTPLRQTISGTPWGYLHMTRGRPAGGVPKVIDPVKKVGDIASIPISWDVTLTLPPGADASLLNDTFWYGDDALTVRAVETGVFGYIGAQGRAFAMGPKSSPIRGGKFVDPTGRTWLARKVVSNASVYAMFIPEDGKSVLKFDGDLKWFADFAMGAGIITADMRFPGTAFGIEPNQGAGTAVFNAFTVGAW